jgi:D-glycerate 3-kinase
VSAPSDQLQAALNATIMLARSRAQGRHVPVVGVAGPQGSGKTTLVKAWVEAHPGAAAFSLDDVYLPATDRRELAARVHPLFATRGPPGTHDLDLLAQTVRRLQDQSVPGVLLPTFDKVTDDRLSRGLWPMFETPRSLVLVDGWCLGASPEADEALEEPINTLEAGEDRLGRWRAYANEKLESAYADAWRMFDAVLYLRAPSFEVIEGWRCEQEAGLLGRQLDDIDRQRISRFVQHFERITRHMLAGGHAADVIVQLDEQRRVTGIERRSI